MFSDFDMAGKLPYKRFVLSQLQLQFLDTQRRKSLGVSEEGLSLSGLQVLIPLILQSTNQQDVHEQQSVSDERTGIISFVSPHFSTIN